MAETSGNGAPAGGNGAPAGSGQAPNQPPGIHVLGQYVKDLSFENPGAPGALRPSDKAPKLDVNVNVNVKQVAQGDFEVELKLEANAARGEDTLFIVEVTYAGLFQIRNVPQEHLQPLLLIECPRLLFPFARQIVADATRQGGFPPLMIDPIDFTALYRQRAAQAAAQQPAAQPS
jgi:preprotein translocase subunit SecB